MLEQLLEDGWAYHDTQSARLAAELEAAVAEATSMTLAPFVQLATHTIGEHLGDWRRALAVGRQVLAGRTPGPQDVSAWMRVAMAANLAGELMVATDLELRALAVAEDPLAQLVLGRLAMVQALASSGRIDEATQLYSAASSLAQRVGRSALVDRAIAVSGNNLAWSLQELAARSAEADGVMRLAAEASLAAWRRCGDWISEEQALHLNACVALALGDQERALSLADNGLQVIQDHSPRPFDAARLQLVRARVFASQADPAGEAAALAAADAEAKAITVEALKPRYAVERAKVVR